MSKEVFAIKSFTDNDLYKFTMQQAVYLRFGTRKIAKYRFVNRNLSNKFTKEMVEDIIRNIEYMSSLSLQNDEQQFLENTKLFHPLYIGFLKNLRYDHRNVFIDLDKENNLIIEIIGNFHTEILWEVPLMAIISYVYFKHTLKYESETEFYKFIENRFHQIVNDNRFNKFQIVEGGTRRRFSYEIQDHAVKSIMGAKFFAGTSNVHIAKTYGLKPVGTTAHEWTMANSGIYGLEKAHEMALKNWTDVYKGKLGIALTDTFGSDAFFKDFDPITSRIYDGLRHDSGDPLMFIDKAIAHYKSHGIDTKGKILVFSDGLKFDFEDLNKIYEYAKYNNTNSKFLIGTDITNRFPTHKALNIVIKLVKIDDTDVVKISDNPTKAIGESNALKNAFEYFKINK